MHRRIAGLLLLLVVTPLFGRSLHWSSFDVTARLDAEGRLHVIEQQTIVFDGDWNGGERRFDIRTGQTLEFHSLTRIGDDGTQHKLARGNLANLDTWQMMDGNVLRWRSRMPDDPPFENRTIVYILDYTLGGVLREQSGEYRLAHDFAFPDREEMIRGFTLRFELDPAWHGLRSPLVLSRDLIPLGHGEVVTATLTYHGDSAPAAVIHPMSPLLEKSIAILFLAALGSLAASWYLRERAFGRFGPIDLPTPVDEEWLDSNVLNLPPEVAGAALRGSVGPASVAAFLARMTHEKKISSRVEKKRLRRAVLHLRLEVDRSELDPTELKLVKALFSSAKETDTEKIRKRYKNRGFDPAALIAPSIEQQLGRLPGWREKLRRVLWKREALLLAGALVLLITTGILGNQNDTMVIAGVVFLTVPCGVAALIAANFARRAMTGRPLRFLLIALFLAPLVLVTIHYALEAGYFMLHVWSLFAASIWVLAVACLTLDVMTSDEAPERLALRRRLQAARRHLRRELRSPAPRLQDAWYPWLLALGLGRNVDRWFRSFSAATVSGVTDSSRMSSTSSISSSSSGYSFTGGGGAFGGAGASGGWAVAAAGLASGVSAPSSSGSGSSGSSGGGGGGSSSGGGGGGGW